MEGLKETAAQRTGMDALLLENSQSVVVLATAGS